MRAALSFAERFADLEGGPFGPSVPVPADAPPSTACSGATGRDRDWTPKAGPRRAERVEEQVEQPAGLVPLGRAARVTPDSEASTSRGRHVRTQGAGRDRRRPAATRPRSSIRSRLTAYGLPPEAITAFSASAMPRLVVM